MVSGGAEERVEKPEARPEGRTRNVREYGQGAPSATAPRGYCCQKVSELMEAVVERENHARYFTDLGLVSLQQELRRLNRST